MIDLSPDQVRVVVAIVALGSLLALGIFVRAEWDETPWRWRVVHSIFLVQQAVIAGAFYQASRDPSLGATTTPFRTYALAATCLSLLIVGGWFASARRREDRWTQR